MSHSWRVVGHEWNRTLEPSASTIFGFCLDQTQEQEILAVDDSSVPAEDPHADMPMENPHTDTTSGFIDLATFGLTHGSDHTDHTGLVGGRTVITTEVLLSYNNLRAFAGLAPATLDEVGVWAFANTPNNSRRMATSRRSLTPSKWSHTSAGGCTIARMAGCRLKIWRLLMT